METGVDVLTRLSFLGGPFLSLRASCDAVNEKGAFCVAVAEKVNGVLRFTDACRHADGTVGCRVALTGI